MFWTKKDGKFYDSNNKVVKKDNPKAKSGVIKKVAKEALNKTKNLFFGSESEINSLNGTDNSGSSNNENKHHNSSIDHNEPPSPDTKESITENSPTSKSIQSQIESIEAKD